MLEQVFKFVEAKEAGKLSATHLLVPQYTAALSKSTYLSGREESVKEELAPHYKEKTTRAKDETYTYCGKGGHGCYVSTWMQRRECPKYGQQCNQHCYDNHFEQVCMSKPAARSKEHEDAIFNSLCTVITHSRRSGTILDHHLYNQFTDTWMKQLFQPQPYIKLQMRVECKDYT